MTFFCGKTITDATSEQVNFILSQKERYFNIFRTTKIIETLPKDRLLTIHLSTKYYLFLTTFNNIPITFIINFELEQYFVTRFRFDEAIYSNTIIAGEFFRNDKCTWSFYIEDLYLDCNIIPKDTLVQRLERIYEILKHSYKWDEYINICHLELKPYFLYDQLNKSNCMNIKTIVIVPDLLTNEPYYLYEPTHQPIIEPPKKHMNTIIAIVKPVLNEIDSYTVTDKVSGEYIGKLLVKTLQDSVYIRSIFKKKQFLVAKCKFIPELKKWYLVQGGKV